jgi:hypothetical protein
MLKDYKDRRKAKQTDKWRFLIYEGQLQGEEFLGKWWYKGFEDS